ncbi:hypothetical protein BGX38DRAFT_1238002 [Terfezia claveryi]|nr:hypothetical protein BGX38DRAFT_1238002 [Terfezia claveryi]
MPSPSTQSAAVPVSLPLDIQTIIIRDYLIAEYRIHRARTYRVPASYDIRKKSPDRHTFKFQFEGLHNLRDLQALCKQNPTLATYTRELRVVSGDWEAPPKSVLTCMSPSNVSYRRVAPEPTVLEQFIRQFYVSNPATGLPKCFAPLMTGYADQKLEFLDSLEIKAHNVSKPTLRRMLPPVFYPAPLLPIVLAARELRTLALRTEVLSEDSTTGTPDSDSDDGAIIPRAVPGFELFVKKPLRTGAPDLLSRAYRDLRPDTYDDDDLQDQWQEMKSYSLAFGDQDAWGDAYFFSRLEPFMRASVEQLTRMPKIEKWEVGCIDLCMTVIVTRDRYSESALCHHTKNYIPSNRVKEILRERWPQVSFETSLGPRMMDWRGLGSYVPITWDSELYPHRFG